MAVRFDAASSEGIYIDTSPVTSYPISISAWFNPDDVTAEYGIVALLDSSVPFDRFGIVLRGNDGGDPIRALRESNLHAASTTSTNSGAWNHGLAVYSSDSSAEIWLNGGGYAQNTSTESQGGPGTFNRICVGGLLDSTPASYLNGMVAEVAVWSGTLDATDAAVLAAGFSPRLVKPNNLVFYAPLIRDRFDYFSGTAFSDSGTPTVDDHPPMVYPATTHLGHAPFVGGGGATTISGGLESLSLTEFQSNVALDLDIASNLESLAITENPASVALDVTVSAQLESMTIGEFAATVVADTSITGALESLSITENQSTVALDVDVSAALESLSITPLSGTVALDTVVAAALESLQITENSATVTTGSAIQAALESLGLTEYAATVVANTAVSAALESLSLTENAAQVAIGTAVAAAIESLQIVENQSTIAIDVNIQPGLESLIISELAGQVGLSTDINAGLESLTITENGAVIALNNNVSATLESLTIENFQATVLASTGTIDSPGLQFTFDNQRLHYTLKPNKLHFTFKKGG